MFHEDRYTKRGRNTNILLKQVLKDKTLSQKSLGHLVLVSSTELWIQLTLMLEIFASRN